MAVHLLRDDLPGELREDGWQNAYTGLGGVRDKQMAHTIVGGGPTLSDDELDALFNTDDLAARIVCDLPLDATRGGFRLAIKGTSNEESTSAANAIVAQAQQLGVMPKLREAWIWGRLYGAGAVFVGTDDGSKLSEPLELEKVRAIKFLNVLRRPQLRIEKRYERFDAPKFGEPELYEIVVGSKGSGQFIHESRLVMFGGQMTARTQPRPNKSDWDNSVLQRVLDAVRMSSSSWLSVSHLLTDASQGVLKIQDFVKMLAGRGEDALRLRMQMMEMGRSVCRSLVVDADKESFERVATSFTGIPEVLDRMMMRVSSAAEEPQTRLFGRAPAGLNATGESDMRIWYDRVDNERNDKLRPQLEQMVRLIMAVDGGATKGKQLDEWEIHFPPLWQPTAKERAETLKIKSDALVALVNGQIVHAEEAALKLAHEGDFDEIDVDTLEELLEAAREARLAGEDPTAPDEDPDDPNVDPDDEPQDKSGTKRQDA